MTPSPKSLPILASTLQSNFFSRKYIYCGIFSEVWPPCCFIFHLANSINKCSVSIHFLQDIVPSTLEGTKWKISPQGTCWLIGVLRKQSVVVTCLVTVTKYLTKQLK